jgi:hypothetical protein
VLSSGKQQKANKPSTTNKLSDWQPSRFTINSLELDNSGALELDGLEPELSANSDDEPLLTANSRKTGGEYAGSQSSFTTANETPHNKSSSKKKPQSNKEKTPAATTAGTQATNKEKTIATPPVVPPAATRGDTPVAATPTGALAKALQVIDLLGLKASTTVKITGTHVVPPGLEALSQRAQASSLADDSEHHESYIVSSGLDTGSEKAQVPNLAGDNETTVQLPASYVASAAPWELSQQNQASGLAGDTKRERSGSFYEAAYKNGHSQPTCPSLGESTGKNRKDRATS